MVTDTLPPWPSSPPTHGAVLLRDVRAEDIPMARELSTDPYVPQTGTLPLNATVDEARAWVLRQQQRHLQGTGFSFTIVESATGAAAGHCGLWLAERSAGRASAGFAIAPASRGRGLAADALRALTAFGWTVPGVHRITLLIEPWNVASITTAERSGYVRGRLLRKHHPIGGELRDVLEYSTENTTPKDPSVR